MRLRAGSAARGDALSSRGEIGLDEMHLTELWPYALIVVSGAALVMVLFMLLVAPRDTVGSPDRRARGRTKPRVGQPAAPVADPVREPSAGARATERLPPPEAVMPPPRSTGPAVPPIQPASRGQPAPVQNGGFGAALRSDERPAAAREEAGFDIPSFLRREAQSAVAEPVPLPAAPSVARPLANGLGSIAFDPPRNLREGDSAVLTVRLVRPQDEPAAMPPVVAGLRGGLAPAAMHLPVSATVSLSAARGTFRIEARSPLIQVLDERRPVSEWSFHVTPLKSGRQRLELTVAGVRSMGGTLEAVDQDVVPSMVAVRVNGRRLAIRAARIAAALLGVVIIAWVVAAYAGPPR